MRASMRSRGDVPRRLRRICALNLVAVSLLLTVGETCGYSLGTCGDVDCSGTVTASDALAVLRKAVGTASVVACPSSCGSGVVLGVPTDALVVCGDFNCSASVTAGDALSLLKSAVGGAVALQCGTECPGVSTTTSTTLPQTSSSAAAVAVVNSVQASSRPRTGRPAAR